MPKHLSHYLNVTLSLALIYDYRVAVRNKRRHKEDTETIKRLSDCLVMTQSQIDYLVSIIDKYEVDFDVFDLIALHSLISPDED